MIFLDNTLRSKTPSYLSTKTENSESTNNWWDNISDSFVYNDILKPFAKKELGITEEERKQNEANMKAYNDIKQNARLNNYGGFTPTQLVIGGAGLFALFFIIKR